jgi:hypothetical protein
VTDAVSIALIDAAKIVIPSAISGYVAIKVVALGRKVDGLLDKSNKAAGDLGMEKGKAAGIEQERNRPT